MWHYRDKDNVEVDLVMTRGARTWGVEVKASATVTPGTAAACSVWRSAAETISSAASFCTAAAICCRYAASESSPCRSAGCGGDPHVAQAGD